MEMNLTPAQRVEVFMQIRTKRGWRSSYADMRRAVYAALQTRKEGMNVAPSTDYSGTCDQSVEQSSGNSYAAYPYGQSSPNGNECGGDPDDIVLLYNTPNAPNTNANNVRWYSTLWWVRWAVNNCYSSGLAAHGLCSTGTRVCIGSCAQALLPDADLNYIYLWQQ